MTDSKSGDTWTKEECKEEVDAVEGNGGRPRDRMRSYCGNVAASCVGISDIELLLK